MKNISLVAIAVLCALTIGYFVGSDRKTPVTHEYGLFFPHLVDQLNDVSQIRITTNQDIFAISDRDNKWRLDVAAHYPVRFDLVQKFLIGMSQLRILEPKTDKPDKHAYLNLAGMGHSDSPTILVVLGTEENDSIAEVYVGKSSLSKKNPGLNEFYVRKPHDNQTWLTESALEVMTDAFAWLDSTIVDIDRNRVEEVILADGETRIRVSRSSPDRGDFVLEGIPTGYELRHQFIINDISDLFGRLAFTEVRSADGWLEGGKTATLSTYDGLELIATAGTGDFDGFFAFKAQAVKSDNDAIVQDADTLNEKFAGWVYKLSSQRIEMINIGLEDLIQPVAGD